MKPNLATLLVLLAAVPACKKTKTETAGQPPDGSAPVGSTPGQPVASDGAAGAEPLAAGAIAPDFTLPAHDGTTASLSGLRGGPVVLYFYPMDDTPG